MGEIQGDSVCDVQIFPAYSLAHFLKKSPLGPCPKMHGCEMAAGSKFSDWRSEGSRVKLLTSEPVVGFVCF